MTGPTVPEGRWGELRQALSVERRRLERLLENMDRHGLSLSQSEALGELSAYDNHPADTGDELLERSKDLAIKSMVKQRLADIDSALERMDDGRYGICQNCGRPIPLERLQALPTAEFCVQCQARQEPSPGGATDPSSSGLPALAGAADEDSEHVAYDREDAWQDVEQYGTSSSPPRAGDTGPMLK